MIIYEIIGYIFLMNIDKLILSPVFRYDSCGFSPLMNIDKLILITKVRYEKPRFSPLMNIDINPIKYSLGDMNEEGFVDAS